MWERSQLVRSREELVRLYAEVSQQHGPRVGVKKFCRLTGVPEPRVYQYFDSFGDLRVAVGLERRIKLQPWYSDDDLLQELHEVVQRLRRLPTCAEFTFYSRTTVQRLFYRFGSYHKALAAYWVWARNRRDDPPADEPANNPQRIVEDPDLIVPWMRRTWCGLRVGFEHRSRDFDGRPADACDLLVVLKHDWPACPVRVLEFGEIIEGEPPR